MSSWRAFLEMVHHLALAIWLGVVVSAGVFAFFVFTTMKQLDPLLPAYAKHPQRHWLIAGGHLGQKVFLFADVVQFTCAFVSVAMLLCLVVLFGLPRRRPATIVRSLALTLAFACAAGEVIIVGPAFNASIRKFWAAAEQGLIEEAAKHQAAADQLHPIASWLLSGSAVGVLIALLAGLWSLAKPWGSAAGSSAGKPSPYPEPAIRTGARA